jgi:hypothetical protein
MHDITKSERKALRDATGAASSRVRFAEQMSGDVHVLVDGKRRATIRRQHNLEYALEIEDVSINYAKPPTTLAGCQRIAEIVFGVLLRAEAAEEEEAG